MSKMLIAVVNLVMFSSVLIGVMATDLPMTNATAEFVRSTESEYDHEVTLKEGDLFFHWNDVQKNTIECRLIHKAPLMEAAPSFLGVGFYDTFNNEDTDTPSSISIAGSEVVIGLVANANVQKYSINNMEISEEANGTHPMEHQTLLDASIKQHQSDDGAVITVLTFTKEIQESNSEATQLREKGENIFLWVIGPAGETSLDLNGEWGAFKLDLEQVRVLALEGNEGVSAHQSSEVSGEDTSKQNPSAKSIITSSSANTPMTADDNSAPIFNGACSSTLAGYEREVALTGNLAFHWVVGDNLKAALQYQGESWLGFGVSEDGKMIGSSAIIGKPDQNFDVAKYSLEAKSIKGIVPLDNDLLSSSITQGGGVTTLEFEMIFSNGVKRKGLQSFLFAVGATNNFGYHEHRGGFRVDLDACDNVVLVRATSMSRIGAFAAHGTIATLAWAIASPFAITVGWFRTLVPSSWIYIHVFSNVFSFFFTFAAVIIAVAAMSGQMNASHFSDPHHWVGLVLLVLVTFQVMNGFLRPPVEKRDPYAASQFETESGFFKIPSSPREVWYFSHRCTGVSLALLGIYQIHSGLGKFSTDFGVGNASAWFWGYMGIFMFSLVLLKIWLVFEEYRARRGTTTSVDFTQHDATSRSHQESELVPVQFDMTP